MIKIKKNLSTLKDTLKIIESVNPEVDFVFCPEGILVRAVDPPAISMALLRIKKEMFEEYDIDKERVCTFQVDLLSKIIRKVGKKELTIDFDETKVHFISPRNKFSLKFFVGKKDDRPEPNVEGTCVWDIKSTDLFGIISDFSEFGEIIKVNSTEKKELIFETKSNLVEGQILSDGVPIKNGKESCWYSLPAFQNIENIKKIFKAVTFQYSRNMPCQITAEDDNVRFKWVLAPRVEDDV